MSLIVNEKRLPATIKRLFKNSVYEIVGELLQNAQRAGAAEIHFNFNRDAQTITVRDDGAGIAPDNDAWGRILRMADSFYSNPAVEENQNPMGVGLLSLFALELITNVSISSRGKTATIETNKLWTSEDYWANWTDLITDARYFVEGFEIVVKYDEPATVHSYQHLAYKFEYAITKAGDGSGRHAAARGYAGILSIFLDGQAVDASLPAECVPTGENLILNTFYQNNRLRIGQSAQIYSCNAYVVWYGQIIKLDSNIPFLLEVSTGNPVTPLAPTRAGLINDRKLESLRKFVENSLFAALANEQTAKRMKPAFVKNLYLRYPLRATTELPVCVVRRLTAPAADSIINCYADFCDLGEEQVASYREIENEPVEIFDSAVSYFLDEEKRADCRYKFVGDYQESFGASDNAKLDERPSAGWFAAHEGLTSFAGILGGEIYELAAGNRQKLNVKRICWKPGKQIAEFFCEPGEFAVVSVEDAPDEGDFRPITEQIFVFESAASQFIGDVEGLCVAVPLAESSSLADEAARWLGLCGRACFSPDDDYDYDQQEQDFDDSISRLLLELRGDVLSTNWSFQELKTVVEKFAAEKIKNIAVENGEKQSCTNAGIKNIGFLCESGETKIVVKLNDGMEIPLKIASHTYLG